MKPHTKTYMDFFGYGIDDVILCEVSDQVAVDIHHIYAKGMGGRKTFEHEGKTYDINDINNLIGLARDKHVDAHANKITKEELWTIHQQTIEQLGA